MSALTEYLPFSSLDDNVLLITIGSNLHIKPLNYSNKLCFYPCANQSYERYNQETDVDLFYTDTRNISICQSEYIFLENLHNFNNKNKLTLLSLNISISCDLQLFVVHVMIANDLIFSIMGSSETRLDKELSSI